MTEATFKLAAALKTKDREPDVFSEPAICRDAALPSAVASLSREFSAPLKGALSGENTVLPLWARGQSPFGRPAEVNHAFIYSANIYGPSAMSPTTRLGADGSKHSPVISGGDMRGRDEAGRGLGSDGTGWGRGPLATSDVPGETWMMA